uniref:Uncharacterized protein n=1 Tax=Sus scrofa TaxID=9823 RepID=A0A8D0Y1K9_PIG
MCPVPSTVHRESICCECHTRFGGHLPVPRAEAALPYWVPLSLRPQKQIQKMVRFYVFKSTKACRCPCHCFGGRLPMPRDQATMPYWVPQVLRSQKKVVKRQQHLKDIPEWMYHCTFPPTMDENTHFFCIFTSIWHFFFEESV